MSHIDYCIENETSGHFGNLDNPILLYTGISKYGTDWKSIIHKHNYLELFYITAGKGTAIIDNIKYELKPNDLIVVNPGIKHAELSTPTDQLEYMFLAIDNFNLKNLAPNSLLPPEKESCHPVFSFESTNNKFFHYFLELLSETSNKADGYLYTGKSLITLIIINLLRFVFFFEKNKTDNLKEECKTVKTFIDINFSKQISLEELANRTYVSRYHLSHMFKKETGYSPIHYLTVKRIEKAKTLLLSTSDTITEIALNVGYDNPVYFSQIFKKMSGCSPREYRKVKREFE